MKVPTSVFVGMTMSLFGLALVTIQLTVTDTMPAFVKAAATNVVLPEVPIPEMPWQAASAATEDAVQEAMLLLPTPTADPAMEAFAGRAPDTAIAPYQPSVHLDATVNTNANLRSGPGTEYSVVGGAKAGDGLELAGKTPDGEWYQLADGNWIAASLVDQSPADGGVGTAPSLVDVIGGTSHETSPSDQGWPGANLGDVSFAYPAGWEAEPPTGTAAGFGNPANRSQRINVARSRNAGDSADPFGVMQIVRNQYAADPRFAVSEGITFNIVTTGTLDLPGPPVFTMGLAHVAPEIPPVCVVMVEAPVGNERVSLVYMDYANRDCTAEGMATLVPMVESLNYVAATE